MLQTPPPETSELCYLAATDVTAAIRAGTVSAAEVMDAVLTRIEAVNPRLNALVTLVEPELLRAQARAVDARVMAGESTGPLAGVPISIKDTTDTRGLRTTHGSRIFEQHVPADDAVV